VLSPVLLELCRLRIAALLACEAEQSLRDRNALSAGLTEEKIAALAGYATAPAFSRMERACIAYAEQYVLDPHALTDADFADLRSMLGSKEIAALTLAVAVFDATIRFRLALGICTPDRSMEAAS